MKRLAVLLGIGGLLLATGCSGSDPGAGSQQLAGTKGTPPAAGDDGDDDDDDDGANDNVTCSVDADCDSDETCVANLCTGTDGEVDDADEADDADDGEADDADDGEADDGADDEAGDKVSCTADSDCDADEVCTDNVCT
jgi:hypothetical protein